MANVVTWEATKGGVVAMNFLLPDNLQGLARSLKANRRSEYNIEPPVMESALIACVLLTPVKPFDEESSWIGYYWWVRVDLLVRFCAIGSAATFNNYRTVIYFRLGPWWLTFLAV